MCESNHNISVVTHSNTSHQVLIRLLRRVQVLLGEPNLQSPEANVSVVQSESAARPACTDSVSSAETMDTGTACQHDEDTPAGLSIMK